MVNTGSYNGSDIQQSILLSTYDDYFLLDCSLCTEVDTWLMGLSSSGALTQYSASDAFLDSSLNLKVSTAEAVDEKVVYIARQARHSLNSPSYLKVVLTIYSPDLSSVLNTAPEFSTPLASPWKIEQGKAPYVLSLPAIIDEQDHEVNVRIEASSLLGVSVTSDKSQLEVANVEDIGEFEITIRLVDELNLATTYTLTIEISWPSSSKPEEGEATSDDDEREGGSEKSDVCTAKILSLSPLGDLVIQFNTPMKNEFINLNNINGSVLELYVDPSGARERFEGFDPATVNFTWQAVSFEEDELELKLSFL
mmetsp:Transcript_30114/g.46008  ORF Transcript_30114/g.46008 Transcript_30114/m.46008 type:complete len:309 (+) Transcript_30114:598-1524(+)